MYINKILLKGRLGAAPEVFNAGNGQVLCRFSIATKRGEKTVWHKLVAFGAEKVDVIRNFQKGDWLFVEAFFATRETESDGKKKTISEIIVEFVHLVERQSPTFDSDKRAAEQRAQQTQPTENRIGYVPPFL